ncbi:hypothetical protein O181_051988 [Austropuccinia psidii MF-1]|uniref:Uncharacterized protein n=1 Tax=Austropuccinia psidii MF-1 TaxID=1389203 RepID=A0A9Q3HNX1_9BASI|nr:hypothetical protein [Austropuccinia psidii MF-1]
MDLDQDIQVINQKDKNVSPEERHKWRMSEIPPVPKGNSGDIPVSVQELVYGSKTVGVGTSSKSLDRKNELLSSSEEFNRPNKTQDLWKGWTPISCKGQVQKIKAWLKKQSIFSEDQKKELAPKKDNSPVEDSQASTSAKQGKARPKEQYEGQEKGKYQVEQTLPPELHNSKERKDSHRQCVQYGKNYDGIQKEGGGNHEPILSKEIELLKLVSNVETCNKEILAKLNNFEDIPQTFGREIL